MLKNTNQSLFKRASIDGTFIIEKEMWIDKSHSYNKKLAE
jgi:hypothetical protein